ncbi:MAG: peptidylprolyl isomerase [Pyrinomonadaceae bacterium]
MKLKPMPAFMVALLSLALLAFSSATALAQEGELQVVDEVIAQVNDDVITLSMLKRESKERIEALKQGGMPEQKAIDEVTKHQAQIIAKLVNELLLMQKGKELDLSSEVEAAVNRRMLEVAKEQGITTIEKLDQAMRESGLDPAATRQTMRIEMMKQAVIQQEVDRRIYLGLSMEELKKHFQANPTKFTKPESVDLSEIFLSHTGKSEIDVKARATELVTQLRAGADFGSLAAANSEREQNGERIAPKNKGKVGRFEVPNLREDISGAIKNVKVGGVSDPLRHDDGYQILRVDDRTAAGTTPTFNENQVREAMTMERAAKEREAYVQNLRNDAYIKISENYRAAVDPILKLPAATAKTEKEDEKSKNKKP